MVIVFLLLLWLSVIFFVTLELPNISSLPYTSLSLLVVRFLRFRIVQEERGRWCVVGRSLFVPWGILASYSTIDQADIEMNRLINQVSTWLYWSDLDAVPIKVLHVKE